MCVAKEVFGEGDHIGVLVRDRFPGYDNSFKGKRQHCFEHLKRDCRELLEKEPQNAEYQKFVPAFASLLREAMQLRGRGLEDGDYYDEAKRIPESVKVAPTLARWGSHHGLIWSCRPGGGFARAGFRLPEWIFTAA